MSKKETHSSKILPWGIGLSVLAGIGVWLMTGKLFAGLIGCGGALIVTVLVAFFMDNAKGSRTGTSARDDIEMIDSDRMKSLLKEVKRTNPKSLKKEMRDLESQCVRMEKKSVQLEDALVDHFSGSLLTRSKFAATINGVLDLYARNVEDILQRINIFDQDGYELLFKKHEEYTTAADPYKKEIEAVQEAIASNEQIISRIDRLLREISRLSQTSEDLSSLPEMEELSELIEQTPRYRQSAQG